MASSKPKPRLPPVSEPDPGRFTPFSSLPGFAPAATENAPSIGAWHRWPMLSSYPYGTKCRDWEFCICQSLQA